MRTSTVIYHYSSNDLWLENRQGGLEMFSKLRMQNPPGKIENKRRLNKEKSHYKQPHLINSHHISTCHFVNNRQHTNITQTLHQSTCQVVLALKSVKNTNKECDHSNESYWPVLFCGAVYYAVQGGSNFWVCG